MPISRNHPCNTATSTLPFHTSPSTWAANIGFSSSAVIQWVNSRSDPYDAALSSTVDPLAGFPQEAITYSAWRHERPQLGLLTSLRILAKKAAHFNLRTISVGRISQRKAALRSFDISEWARLIKPVSKVSVGFSTSWIITPEGSLRISRNPVEALEGARQEWAKLMVEGNPRWQHPLIFQHVDAWGRPRGSMNLKIACLAPPSDPIRDIATAYMGPTDSGYSILYWSSPAEVTILSESAVTIRGILFSKENFAWRVVGPPLCSKASGMVVCICGEIPGTWDMARWRLWIRA